MNKLTFSAIIALLIFSVCLLLPAASTAAGRISVKPVLLLFGQVDDNFYKEDKDDVQVYTYSVQPGISLGYTTGKSRIDLEYMLQVFEYDQKDSVRPGQQDADGDDYVGHTLKLTSRTTPFDRLTFGLDNDYILTRSSASSDRFDNTTGQEKFWINRLSPMVYYELDGRFSAGARYTYMVTDYSSGTGEDSDENRGSFDLIYTFPWNATLTLDYQVWTRDYDKNTSDYTSNQVMMLFNKQFRQLAFRIGAGYHWRDYDQSGIDDLDTPAYQMGITWAPENTKLHVSLDSEYNINDSGSGNSYYEAFKTTLSAGYLFAHKIPVDISASFQNSDYEDVYGPNSRGLLTEREDDRYRFDASIGYMFTRWATLRLKVGHEERDSNWLGYDYTNTFGGLFLDFNYDLGSREL